MVKYFFVAKTGRTAYLKAFLTKFQMARRITAPMTALTICPYHCAQNGLVAPSLPSSQPPTKPPARPIRMFQIRPPLSLDTKKPESQPATAPMGNVIMMFMVLIFKCYSVITILRTSGHSMADISKTGSFSEGKVLISLEAIL